MKDTFKCVQGIEPPCGAGECLKFKRFCKEYGCGFARMMVSLSYCRKPTSSERLGVLILMLLIKLPVYLFCDSFNIPIVTLMDVPWFMQGLPKNAVGYSSWSKGALCIATCTVPLVTLLCVRLWRRLHCYGI